MLSQFFWNTNINTNDKIVGGASQIIFHYTRSVVQLAFSVYSLHIVIALISSSHRKQQESCFSSKSTSRLLHSAPLDPSSSSEFRIHNQLKLTTYSCCPRSLSSLLFDEWVFQVRELFFVYSPFSSEIL